MHLCICLLYFRGYNTGSVELVTHDEKNRLVRKRVSLNQSLTELIEIVDDPLVNTTLLLLSYTHTQELIIFICKTISNDSLGNSSCCLTTNKSLQIIFEKWFLFRYIFVHNIWTVKCERKVVAGNRGGLGVIFHVKLKLKYSIQGNQRFLQNLKIQLLSEDMII